MNEGRKREWEKEKEEEEVEKVEEVEEDLKIRKDG